MTQVSQSAPQAVIVGAGVAGLAAGLRLAEGGRYLPHLLEKEDRPGGLAKSLHFKGVSSDLGPHRIHTEIPEVARLIEAIAAPSLYTVQRTSHIYLRGAWMHYPPRPLEMTRRLGAGRMTRFALGYAGERLRPTPGEPTYEILMRRAFGRPLYEFLLRPYSEKTWKIDPGQLHADTARVRVSAGSLAKMITRLFRRERRGRETALKEFRYVRGGAETLVRHLWEHAQQRGARLQTNQPVGRLELDDNGNVRAANHGNGPERSTGRVFLSTIPLPLLLGRLLPERPELSEARRAAEGLEYLNMIFVCLIVRRKIISGDNWLYFPEPDLIFNRGYEAKNFDPAMGPEDKSVLCLEITFRQEDPIARESDQALLAAVTEQIASTGLFGAHEVEEGLVYRLPWAYPLYRLDYAQRLQVVFDGLRRIPNLLTLGRQGLFNHNNMDHSIYMGLRAGDFLNREPVDRAVQSWYDSVGEFKKMRIVD